MLKFLFFNGFSSISHRVFNFLKKMSSLKFPFTAMEYYACNSVPVESIIDLLKQNWDENRKVKMRNLFGLSALSEL